MKTIFYATQETPMYLTLVDMPQTSIAKGSSRVSRLSSVGNLASASKLASLDVIADLQLFHIIDPKGHQYLYAWVDPHYVEKLSSGNLDEMLTALLTQVPSGQVPSGQVHEVEQMRWI